MHEFELGILKFFAIPPFGVDGIHHFLPNMIEMRQWCSIPAFEGLLPAEHDAIVKMLLFHLSEWHALTKLQMHSDDSLAQLNQALKRLAAKIRRFQQTTCDAFKTHKLPKFPNNPTSSSACPKSFNILTYKFHALGDYTRSIRMFGTMDSYTTQTVSRL
ncbi:hypothetical protein EDD16DRAFT_1693605 [Pisolithus croceorrhizus]|nr:hypothetical protein EDD16DRAFT_1693605 [Pisolithus croceorrhizus]